MDTQSHRKYAYKIVYHCTTYVLGTQHNGHFKTWQNVFMFILEGIIVAVNIIQFILE